MFLSVRVDSINSINKNKDSEEEEQDHRLKLRRY